MLGAFRKEACKKGFQGLYTDAIFYYLKKGVGMVVGRFTQTLLFTIALVGSLHSSQLYVVTNTLDSGNGSLRWAIEQANAGSGGVINFDISQKPAVINLKTALPSIVKPLTINGYANGMGTKNTATQGTNAQLGVVIQGDKKAYFDGITVQKTACKISGLMLKRFDRAVVVSGGQGTVIKGNIIGTGTQGDASNYNRVGVFFHGASHAKVVANLISGNLKYGVQVQGGSDFELSANLIGTTFSGMRSVPNGSDGVYINNTSNIEIGGTDMTKRNVISGNTLRGLWIDACHQVEIYGNHIGVNASGKKALANGSDGLYISDSANVTIGGSGSESNLISGNRNRGLWIYQSDTVTLAGNKVGTDTKGELAIPNHGHGIYVSAVSHLLIGGVENREPNIISGNGGKGIFIDVSDTATILGNYIGINASGFGALPNADDGIYVRSSNDITIGSSSVGGLNIISGNEGCGISLDACTSSDVFKNYIGLDVTGQVALSNALDGIRLANSSFVTIGADSFALRNIVSGNAGSGVRLTNATQNRITHNYIGYDRNGRTVIKNGQGSIIYENGSSESNNTVANNKVV